MLDKIIENLPTLKIYLGGLLAGPLLAFFNVPAFYMLLLILLLDFVTGIYKSKVLSQIESTKFAASFERAFNYTLVFIVLHSLGMISSPLILVEQVIMAGLALRESISIIENIKCVEIFRGRQNKVLDKVVEVLGLNLDKMLDEVSKTTSKENK
jgi:phage-related holin